MQNKLFLFYSLTYVLDVTPVPFFLDPVFRKFIVCFGEQFWIFVGCRGS